MKVLVPVGLTFLLAGSLFAQRAPVQGRGARFQSPGFGSVIHPGTPRPPVARNPFSITDPGFARRLGSTVSGFPPDVNRRPNHGKRNVLLVPYAYPVFLGGYPYQEPQAPNITIVNTPPPAPQVVINQNFIPEGGAALTAQDYPAAQESEVESSGVRIYDAPSRPAGEPDSGSRGHSYLVAFKDQSIYSAMAYWVDGETLHYVTPQGVHNQASLDLIDRDFTEQLNRERKVQVLLPRN